MKVAENSPQNARNCTIFKNLLGGGMPPNPPSKGSQLRCSRHAASRHVYPKSQKFKVGPPPEKSCIRPWIKAYIVKVFPQKKGKLKYSDKGTKFL